ncbi:lipid II flippase MurJ [Streptomyces sp. CBMA152]|uniref:lipid II flippase MurJ n=1 Tax=Streptomyces sp. CBMA152 TaxID=1896312 RepID=UPI0016614C9B|nr:lipid II flippase MurJ [Streptomyces sp. CBMA152]MBD0744986.1 murein biosynthesis protein MurJ [Streptomyces sp. CBMA152]
MSDASRTGASRTDPSRTDADRTRSPRTDAPRALPGHGPGPGALERGPLGHELEPASSAGRFLARAAAVTAALTVAGAVLGLVRDQTFAHVFGADGDTDAFLVAWTVPEVASTLLIEDGLALVLVPAFSLAAVRRGRTRADRPDPVRALVAATLPRLMLALAAVALLLIVAAPELVDLLAPGLTEPGLAVDCTRLTATCALTFGLAGYCSAALRGHGRFLAPATIYLAYNAGIITVLLAFGPRWGVRAAAAGVAVGGCLMVAAQAPSLWRGVRRTTRTRATRAPRQRTRPDALRLAMVAPVIVFALSRQCQTLVERHLAAPLPAGAISHLNYAQKVAQMPMVLSLMLCTVTFPVVARALAAGERERARRRVEGDLMVAGAIVLLGAAVVIGCAPQIVQLLFQRGAFGPADTAATASVMRVYALGLLAQTMVGVLVRSYFSAARPTWYPAATMLVCLAVTAAAGAWAAPIWGASGIAAANALGIAAGALLLLAGTGRRSVGLDRWRLGRELLKLAAAGAGASAVCWWCAAQVADPAAAIAAGSLAALPTFLVLARAARVRGFAPLSLLALLVRPVTRRLRHAR